SADQRLAGEQALAEIAWVGAWKIAHEYLLQWIGRGWCRDPAWRTEIQATAASTSGIGYSSALATNPSRREKSNRGGAKTSHIRLPDCWRAEVWVTCAGIIVTDGAPTRACTSSRQSA